MTPKLSRYMGLALEPKKVALTFFWYAAFLTVVNSATITEFNNPFSLYAADRQERP